MKVDVQPLECMGLKGRVMRVPARKKRKILVVYGSHASLERNLGLAQAFAQFGSVTMPDLPGHGGMDSLADIGQDITLEGMADYLAEFVRSEYDDQKFTVVGFSLGAVVVTVMLQHHPDLVDQVEDYVSVAGCGHSSDFKFGPIRRQFYINGLRLIGTRVGARIFDTLFVQEWWLRRMYKLSIPP